MPLAGTLAQVAILRGDVGNADILDEIELFILAMRWRLIEGIPTT
jgi:hypothetical protein